AKLRPRSQRAPLSRGEVMARIRSKSTAPERRVCAALHALGIRFRKNSAGLPGKPDITNQRRRWVIFVHGCFWHSHNGCKLASRPKSNSDYWSPKLERNAARDALAVSDLVALGYRAYVIWECQTRSAELLHVEVKRLARQLRRNRSDST